MTNRLLGQFEDLLSLKYVANCGEEPHYVLPRGQTIYFMQNMRGLVCLLFDAVSIYYNESSEQYPYFYKWHKQWIEQEDDLWEATYEAIASCNDCIRAIRSQADKKQNLETFLRHRYILYLALDALRQMREIQRARQDLLSLSDDALVEEYWREVRQQHGVASHIIPSINRGTFRVSNAPMHCGIDNGAKSKRQMVEDILVLRRRLKC